MSKRAKHTPGRVRIAKYPGHVFNEAGDRLVAGCRGHQQNFEFEKSDAENDANAERIVACWNACLDIPDPETAIPAMREALREIRRRVDPQTPGDVWGIARNALRLAGEDQR